MSLTFAIEPVVVCWDEVLALATEHWRSTKSYRRHQPFCPSLARYEDYNERGFFLLYTARDAGVLVSYFGVYLCPSMHSQLLTATEDTFYIAPSHRKGWTAVRFIKFIEQDLTNRGVHEILFSCEAENPAKRLLDFLKYAPVIVQYSKVLTPSIRADSATAADQDCTHVGSA